MIAANAFGMPSSGWLGIDTVGTPMMTMPRTCAVRLIDRRTGSAHRINGRPLLALTRNPAEAAAELMRGRDPAHWAVRIEPLETEGRR